MNVLDGVDVRTSRDQVTVVSYAMVATYAFFLYFVGPVTPLIAADMGLTAAVAGMMGLALALGLVSAGLLGPYLVARVGSLPAGLVATVLLGIAATCLALAPGYPLVLVATFVAAFAGALLTNIATAILSRTSPLGGARSITEANALAAWVGLAAPLSIGAVVAIGWGWRAAALAVALVAIAMFWGIRRAIAGASAIGVPEPAEATEPGTHDRAGDSERPATGTSAAAAPEAPTLALTMPMRKIKPDEPEPGRGFTGGFYWGLLAVIVAVGTEICLNFWGAVLVSTRTGVDLGTATATMAVLIAGIAVGRTVGSRFTHSFRTRNLIVASMLLAAVGFSVVMFSGTMPMSMLGLFVTGLGFALLFPLTQSLTIDLAGDETDRAVGIVAVAIGLTMGLAPFALGALASSVGVVVGFMIVPALLFIGLWAVGHATSTVR